jgi:hypothetical protein
MLDVHEINESIRAAQAEIAEIDGTDLSGFRPRDRDFKGRMLARRADLQETIKVDMARALTVAQSDLGAEREKAIEHFRAAEERATKAQTILDAADRLRAEAAARDAEAKARAIVNAERMSAGKKPLPSESE